MQKSRTQVDRCVPGDDNLQIPQEKMRKVRDALQGKETQGNKIKVWVPERFSQVMQNSAKVQDALMDDIFEHVQTEGVKQWLEILQLAWVHGRNSYSWLDLE